MHGRASPNLTGRLLKESEKSAIITVLCKRDAGRRYSNQCSTLRTLQVRDADMWRGMKQRYTGWTVYAQVCVYVCDTSRKITEASCRLSVKQTPSLSVTKWVINDVDADNAVSFATRMQFFTLDFAFPDRSKRLRYSERKRRRLFPLPFFTKLVCFCQRSTD